jgi:catechol 2,3-dioxygenase
MGVRSGEIFGGSAGEPATPGSYGQAPAGFRLPADTKLGPVQLRVSDLRRSVAYYETVLGMRVVRESNLTAALGPHDDDRELVVLHEHAGARPSARRGRTGLFHFAILLPDRPSLGRFVKHLGDIGAAAGAGDHLVSEAFYLQDPDDLGIEVYADRPRSTWRRLGPQLMMGTDPVDTESLVASAGDSNWTGMPAGTVMGHVHLHVGNIDASAQFFSETLGFDRMVWNYPGALFLAAGGYHHHLGTNIWSGTNARPTAADEAGLIEWTIELPDVAALDRVAQNLGAAGVTARREGTDVVTADPWGTAIRLRLPDR